MIIILNIDNYNIEFTTAKLKLQNNVKIYLGLVYEISSIENTLLLKYKKFFNS